jgi:hypothetical protein
MAIATACGMLSSTLLTLRVVPVFYLVFDDFADRLKALVRRRRRGAAAQQTVVSAS